jgi:hypothetical protein
VLDSNELRDKNISLLEETETQHWSPAIDDKEYIADLRKLRELRSFLIGLWCELLGHSIVVGTSVRTTG